MSSRAGGQFTADDPAYPHIVVQLTGEDGNPMMIIGRVRRALRAAGVSAEAVTRFSEAATAGNYDDLLATAQRWVTVA